MLREGQIVGSLIVRRKRTGDFSEETVDLLETFASQSALALLNAQLYRELKQQSLELELASRHKSEFLASMSHELRTPLNAVLGFSEVLLERMFGDINERQEEYLRDIHGSGKHLLELLNEILDLSKVEAGRMELEYSSFDLRALLDDAASMLRERAATHGIDLRVETGADVGPVYSDELRLKQVVLNLMTNAVKFTGDGGAVEVRAERSGPEIDITVKDTGIGVPRGRPRADLRVLPAGRTRRSPARRAPASVSPCPGASWSSWAAGCGWRARWGREHLRLLVAGPSRHRRGPPTRLDVGRGRGRGHRGRPSVAGSLLGVPVGCHDQGHRGARRPDRARSRAQGASRCRAAGHPVARHRRVGGAPGS